MNDDLLILFKLKFKSYEYFYAMQSPASNNCGIFISLFLKHFF